MPLQIQVTGLVEIQLELQVGTIVTLGYSEDMIDIEENAFWHNVPGDQHGGPQGPPIDVQYLGQIDIIRAVMSTWDETYMDVLRTRRVNAVLGTVNINEVGQLMLQQNPTRVILNSPTRPLNYPTCIVREAISFPMGTKYSAATVIFEAHRTPGLTQMAPDGLLFNNDVAAGTPP